MQAQEAEQQYYYMTLTHTRDFLKWMHTHRLLDGPGEFQDRLWEKQPATKPFRFGGKFGKQFRTAEDFGSFSTAFDETLHEHGIPEKHKANLLYLICFLHDDYEQQSIIRNRHNQLHDYASFIIELIADSEAHIKRMHRNKDYVEINDPYTGEFFFARKALAESMPEEELLEYLPTEKNGDDVIKYLRITICDHELYVPNDLLLSVNTTTERNLITSSGEQKSDKLTVPLTIQYEMFTYMLKLMLDMHRKYDTMFYKALSQPELISPDLKDYVNNHYKRHALSPTQSLARIGVLVSDYLIANKTHTSKRSIAAFLFEYFALFKAIKLKRTADYPENYSELIPFYIKNKVNSETVRNLMKDVGEI